MSKKTPDEKTKEELQLANYRLNRLMSKLQVSNDDDEVRYENACHEVGRLQGIVQGLELLREIQNSG